MTKRRGRPPITYTPPPEPRLEVDAQAIQRAHEVAHWEAGVEDEKKHVANESLLKIGHMQAFASMADLTMSAALDIYEEAVMSNAHIGLAYRKPDGSLGRVEDAKGFCEHILRRPYKSVAEALQDRRLLGAATFERLQQLGLQRADFRALRNLQKSGDAAIVEAVSIPDPAQRADKLAILLDQACASHEEAQQKLRAARDDLDAARERIRVKNDKLEEITRALQRRENGQLPACEAIGPIAEGTHKASKLIVNQLNELNKLIDALAYISDIEWEKPRAEQDKLPIITEILRMDDELKRIAARVGHVQLQLERQVLPLARGFEVGIMHTRDDDAGEPAQGKA